MSKTKRRVVVTGMGCVSPLGIGVKPTWDALVAGQSGIGRVKAFDPSGMDSQIAGEVKGFVFDSDMLGKKKEFLTPWLARTGEFVLTATREALEDAGLMGKLGEVGPVCMSLGGHEETYTMELMHKLVPLEFVVRNMRNNVASLDGFPAGMADKVLRRQASAMLFLVGATFGCTGPAVASSSACGSGAYSIGRAKRMVENGVVDVAITGGAEAMVNEIIMAMFGNVGVLSMRNNAPKEASRPFDKDRDGFVIAEGGVVLILEALGHAKSRGAHVYAELMGYGTSSNAYRFTDFPLEGEGPDLAVLASLKDAGLTPENIDYINAHGTATKMNDVAEVQAIKKVFGCHAYEMPISASKSMVGHMIAGIAALEAVVCVKTLNEHVIHPTINLENPDPMCDLDFVPHGAREAGINVALSNSFGFGGQNASLIFRAFGE